MLNLAVFTGRIANDLELLNSGEKQYVRFRVAVQRDYKNAQDEYDSDFIPCIAWGPVATLITNHFRKGSRLTVKDGSLRSSSYVSNGNTIYGLEVLVKAVDFLDPKPKSDVNYKLAEDPLNT